MLSNLIARLGDWNPQFLRELKGRFTKNHLIAIAIVSILIQLLILTFSAITQTSLNRQIYSSFNFLNWAIPVGLMLGSVYAITTDLNREERQGTFDFIRLTPQSARSIFFGKILGVPSSIYLVILLVVPLHLIVGILAGNSMLAILAWYLTIGMAAYFCLSLVIFSLLHGKKRAILLTLLFAVPVNIFTNYYNFYTSLLMTGGGTSVFSWLYLPVDRNIYWLDLFIAGTFLSICCWLWVAIDRQYLNPNNTALSKQDSYWMNIQFQTWLLGFAIPICTQYRAETFHDRSYLLAIFYSINAVFIYCTIPLILPSRSSVEHWYYNREHIDRQHRHWWQQDLIRDFVWDDRTPIGLAMLVNLSIPVILWGLCFGAFFPDRVFRES
jgi:ABC-type transport system involved in cytochrome c biogenesis permease component